MIKAVIFDCFGVLTTDRWREFCATIPEGPDLEKAHELNHAYDAGLISMKDFIDGVRLATGKAPEQVEDLLAGDVYKNTDLLEYIAQLKSRYKIGLLSNVGTNWIRDTFLTRQEQELFDVMVLSFEAGITKPDPRIFQLICDRLDVQMHEAVMVDDIDRYSEAARDAGMQAVTYQNFSQLKDDLAPILYQR